MSVILFLFLVFNFVYICSTTNSSLTFFVIGDWGGQSAYPYTTPIQLNVASAMGTLASTLKPSFVLTVGDNFYDVGVTSAEDPRWAITFESVYSQSSLQIPWYPVAGNRDHYGNVTAQVIYTRFSKRWNFTSLNYDVVFKIPDSNATVHVIAFNTWDLTSTSRENDSQPFNPVKQYEVVSFVSEKLRTSNATWKVLLSHYPIWSAGAHGPNDPELVYILEPIVLRWKPDIYLAGHDHNSQHLTVNGIEYYVVGGCSDVSSSWVHDSKLPTDSIKFRFPMRGKIGAFASVTVTENNLTVSYYSEGLDLLYQNTHVHPPPQPDGGNQPAPSSDIPLPTTPTPTTSTPDSNTTHSFVDPSRTTSTQAATNPELYVIVFLVVGIIILIAIGLFVYVIFRKRNSELY